jgi:hypothetical protein
MKELKVVRGSVFKEEHQGSDSESSEEGASEKEESSSDSDEPALEKRNKAVDRTEAKTQAQRNRDRLNRMK